MTLGERRTEAAHASGGRSDDAIHRAALRELLAAGARGRLLDVGAGHATFALLAHDTGRFDDVVATDLVRFADVPPAIGWIECDLNESLPIPDESFDSLVAIEVIEHLENPWAVARDWYRVLRPGGIAVVTTPNNESLRSLLYLALRGHFAAFGEANFPAHLTALLRTDLRRVFAQAGFEVARFFPSGSGVVPSLTHLTWQQISGGLLAGIRFSDNVGCVVRRPA